MELSIIVCTYNRCAALRNTLESVAALSVPDGTDWELIVVDNNSTDGTHRVAREFAGRFLHMRYLFEPRQGLSFARNRGIGNARGDIVAFIDDDVLLERDWMRHVIEGFRRERPSAMGGKVLVRLEEGVPEWFSAAVSDPLCGFDKGESVFFPDSGYRGMIGVGANMCYSRDVFARYGLFDTGLGRKGKRLVMGEETEFDWRIIAGGEKCIYYPYAVAHHCVDAGRLTKRYFRRWYYRIGEWNYITDRFAGRIRAPSLLGIPRWRFRKAAEDAVAALRYAAARSSAEAFEREVAFIEFVGYFLQRVKVAFGAG